MPSANAILKPLIGTLGGIVGIYAAFLVLLTIPTLQDHVVYLHRVTLTWFQDVNVPEQWGFLHNQVTPFYLKTADGERLHSWHVLPLDIYRQHQEELRKEMTGLCEDIEHCLSFELLKHNPTAQLVVYLHGAAGTLSSGWRPQSYRAVSAACANVHVLAIDYRGFGTSSGWPSEAGLLTDALTLVEFAVQTAGIPPERIVLFGQSLGTAVALSLTHYLATQSPPVLFAGTVLVAPFADVASLARTYKIAGTIPLLSPVARCAKLFNLLNSFIINKWPSQEKLERVVQHLDSIQMDGRKYQYDITLIHAEDEFDIPMEHSHVLFWRAVNATSDAHTSMAVEEMRKQRLQSRSKYEAGAWEMEWYGKGGVIREQIVKYGLHDRIMSYPVLSLAVARAFRDHNGAWA